VTVLIIIYKKPPIASISSTLPRWNLAAPRDAPRIAEGLMRFRRRIPQLQLNLCTVLAAGCEENSWRPPLVSH